LEQIIDVHKYLQLQIPTVFKEFVESLMYFRFMDFTAVLNFSVSDVIAQLCSNDLDNHGPIKVVYYESGANFYKNMVQVMISVLLILIANAIIYGLVRVIPCRVTYKLSVKIKTRAIITLNDLVESMAIPTSLFAIVQLSYVTWSPTYIWIYVMSYLFVIPLLLFPFGIVIYVNGRMRAEGISMVEVEIYEDLMQDCKVRIPITSIFYLYNFYRKIAFGVILGSSVPGLAQVLLLILINSGILGLLGYAILHNVFNSRVKMIMRTLNLLSVLAIEVLILCYNLIYCSIETMILIGVSCTYMTVVITGVSMLEVLLKCAEILLQKIKRVRDNNKSTEVEGIANSSSKGSIECNNSREVISINFQENKNADNSISQ
jgi:hypothetical protein